MGWLKLGSRGAAQLTQQSSYSDDLKATIQHIETLNINSESIQQYPHVQLSVPDLELPFIPPEEVRKRKSAAVGGLFIVVDEIVYDCSMYIKEHPGGKQIIESFAGAECSWQFWRFHGRKEMAEFGRPLRVGRTKGLHNKFKEPLKYVGLRKMGNDEWN